MGEPQNAYIILVRKIGSRDH